jgi:hypothetical protein
MGGIPAIRITTGINNNLTENAIVRIDGLFGSTQLNNNVYYVKIISTTVLDLYEAPYNPALYAQNYPITFVSSYISGGYIWVDQQFIVANTVATSTTANGNRITIGTTNNFTTGTPVYFTLLGSPAGTDILGGIQEKTEYYVLDVNPEILAGNFIVGNEYEISYLGSTDWNVAAGTSAVTYVVGDIFTAAVVGTGTGLALGLQEFTITANRYPNETEVILSDAAGAITVSLFQQVNVDRLWVTVDGYRVPSSSLKLNPYNDLSILTTITSGSEVIITSMMPSATPNEAVYLLNVSLQGNSTVFRANTQTRTWLTHPLQNTDQIIYLNDVSRVTDSIVQNVTCPAEVDGVYSIGIAADKNAICQMIVYNNTTLTEVSAVNYEIVIIDTVPILQITSQVTAGDLLTITSVEGRLIYINGEQIGFGECDFTDNSISQLTRGANGTGVQVYIPEFTEVFGIISSNRMSNVLYSDTWNPIPGIYNTVEGDPLQIADTQGADFLRTDRN